MDPMSSTPLAGRGVAALSLALLVQACHVGSANSAPSDVASTQGRAVDTSEGPKSWAEYKQAVVASGELGVWTATDTTQEMWEGVPAGLRYTARQSTHLSEGGDQVLRSHRWVTEDGKVLTVGTSVTFWDEERGEVVGYSSGFDMGVLFSGESTLRSVSADGERWHYTEHSRGVTTHYEQHWRCDGDTMTLTANRKDQQGEPWTIVHQRAATSAGALSEAAVREFAVDFHAGLVGYEAGAKAWREGLTEETTYFNAGFAAPQKVDLSMANPKDFWEDSVTCDVKGVKVYGDCASVYGAVTYKDFDMTHTKRFHGVVVERGGRLVWDRWMEVADGDLSLQYMGYRTEVAGLYPDYFKMYWAAVNGDAETARSHGAKLLEKDPTLGLAYIGEATACWFHGDPEGHKAAFAKAAENMEGQPMAARLFVQSINAATTEEKLTLARKALVLAPDDPMLALQLAYFLFAEADNAAEALAIMRRVAWRWPACGGVHNMLGYLELAAGNQKAAGDHFRMYARVCPEIANAHDSLGDYQVAVGDKEGAMKSFARALELDPKSKVTAEKLQKLREGDDE